MGRRRRRSRSHVDLVREGIVEARARSTHRTEWPAGASQPGPRTAKLKAEDFLRGSGLPAWTILRPGFFTENLPTYLAGDRMVTGLTAGTTFGLIAADDIGGAAVIASLDPDRFAGQTIGLVGDVRTYAETA